ncbi:MAG: hypothetical protein DRQ61_02030 [Gammaproteobacteria bacterium]|nr:MAG: hypothetical protein DRQ56_01350 [Gammaproteobacteria bacterium]RLA24087.1 MAG: hypothetical protein DRQ61_02030 [Gammaproteobacteria bacterium]
MISATWLVVITIVYLLLLFYIAYRGDQKPVGQFSRYQTFIFTLSLMVYCSSWTIFGAAGRAVLSGWEYLSIYAGPIFVFVFCFPLLKKLVIISKRQKTVSIADFIGSRYGKNRSLAAMVTMIALVGTIPYIALQLKAVAGAFDMLSGRHSPLQAGFILSDTAFYLSLILILFSIFFGARRIDATVHHRGIINALSFESIVKIGSLLAIAVLAYFMISEEGARVALGGASTAEILFAPFNMEQFSVSFFTQSLLSATAIFCLPRQFHIMAVEGRGDELSFARWGFPLLLLLVSLSVIPIAAAGLHFLNSVDNSDLYVLSLPLFDGSHGLAVLGYLGGLSAATGMVIVATVALSTMVSNDLVLPILLRFRQQEGGSHYYPILLFIRRITICVLLGLAYGYYRIAIGDKTLSSIGLLSFAAAIQFSPAIVGGLYWQRGHKNGAMVGLLSGFFLWFYTLMLPTLADAGWFSASFISSGPLGLALFAPQNLLGFEFSDRLTHGLFWSLGVNIGCYILFSLRAKPSLTDKLQAAAFVEVESTSSKDQASPKHTFKVADLADLCGRFVGKERVDHFFFEIESERGAVDHTQVADVELLKKAEQMMAGSVGAAMAESILNTALQAAMGNRSVNVVSLLSQTSEAIEFNRELLNVTLNNINQGISVVDQHLCLVAYNKAYLSLLQYPEGFIELGMPIEKIIRFNTFKGAGVLVGSDGEVEVKKRIDFLRSGEAYSYERTWKDGTVIQTEGNRLPNGGYVTTYTDITALKVIQNDLRKSNEELEEKVGRRTEKLLLVNNALQEAMESKSRFMTAASHDLSQPLSAGKLYLGALLEDLEHDDSGRRLAGGALSALYNAESLLKSLFEISRLDSNAWEPEIEAVSVKALFSSLETEFSVIAKDKGIRLKVVGRDCYVRSDQNLLHSILRNFLSNAVRYTKQGAVMLLCRYGKEGARIEVRDSGIGIAEKHHGTIFKEYHQLHKTSNEGYGLGLAISKRVAERLEHQVGVRSKLGKGSVFYLNIHCITGGAIENEQQESSSLENNFLETVKVLCVDDEAAPLEAISEVMRRWGATVSCAKNYQEYTDIVSSGERFEVILADYHLRDGSVGLDLLKDYRNRVESNYLGVLVTAERGAEIEDEAILNGFGYLPKPLETKLLKMLLAEGLR